MCLFIFPVHILQFILFVNVNLKLSLPIRFCLEMDVYNKCYSSVTYASSF